MLSAQDFRATLNGRVTDPHNAAIAGAVVLLRDVEKSETLRQTTDHEGNYVFTLIQPGNYELTVTHPGFKNHKRSGLTLNVNQTASLDVKLELGSTSEQVTVTADVFLLQSRSGDRGGFVGGKNIAQKPLKRRKPFLLSSPLAVRGYNGSL